MNDISGELVNLYRVVQHHLEEFVRQFKWALISREMYKWLQITPEVILTDIQRAARFYYLQKMAFGGRVSSQVFGTATTTPPRMNLLRIEEELSSAHLRLARTYIEHLDWKTCIQKYDRPHTLFYADPPYWQTEGYGVPFPFEEYQALAEVMRSCKGKVVLSINDHPDIRDVFADFRMEQVAIQYSVNPKKGKSSAELVICSW
ncbi:methyl-directed repair DNA adenine methylase [Aquitalea magnusonii]|uniref:site-specific DNA-methyltransferase (adenine-specific) n=1 Tax=Aquitalea magnusonii TaxID=332411 RepID=A0A3G9GF92_9NEIS|nr:DNA adenine methylase [Aquitalea magnusonii]BBF84921.1 methyl-directed repair DNA adenine methylase [Aquitalea magnusonii]